MLPRMMEAAGVTEELKAHDPMRWVGLMNTLKAVSYTHLDVYKRQVMVMSISFTQSQNYRSCCECRIRQ